MAGGQPRTNGPVRLNELFDQAFSHLQPQSAKPVKAASSPVATDGFLFSGNHHDSVPRALLMDGRLTPLERNGWQVFRLMLAEDGITAMPTYDQLAPWLASMPCAARASHETVARTLTMLRLTRWISLVRRRRDPRTGRILGNLYVLHDEPLTPYEAIQLDADYLALVSQSLVHASKSVQRVGVYTLQEMSQDAMLIGQVLPTRLQVLTQRLSAQGWRMDSRYPQDMNDHDSEEGTTPPLRNDGDLTSDSKSGLSTSKINTLRNPKSISTVPIKENNKKILTVPRAQGLGMLRLPERFMALKAEQQSGALAALQSVEPNLHQSVLDEWDARCTTTTIRNPAGYLFGIIQKALRGDFRAWAGQKDNTQTTPATKPREAPIPPQPPAANRDVALAHLARLRKLLDAT
ncbi:STY4528 family pathogenicity island replication protein [Pectobacterium carotovorum]|uniref:STY4528 family pathogenicity island replication protein n=1 Tax=Pectobacterium carotovorum TaxID=554 RepID=UPI0030178A93